MNSLSIEQKDTVAWSARACQVLLCILIVGLNGCGSPKPPAMAASTQDLAVATFGGQNLQSAARDEKSADPWNDGMADLAHQLGQRLRWEKGRMKVAVLDFPTVDGAACALSAPVAEELTTRLFEQDKFSLIERRMLAKVREESMSAQTDLFDPQAVASLGRLVGADGIVSGTITASERGYTFNARIVLVESAEVASVAKADFSRKVAEERGTCRGVAAAPNPGSAGSKTGATSSARGQAPETPRAASFWKESFAKVTEGMVPRGWNASERMMVAGTGRSKALQITSESGEGTAIVSGLVFPADFRLSIVLSRSGCGVGVQIQAGDLLFTAGDCGRTSFMGESIPDLPDRQRHLVAVERSGQVMKMLIDGQVVKVIRKAEFSAGDTVRIELHDAARIYSIEGQPL